MATGVGVFVVVCGGGGWLVGQFGLVYKNVLACASTNPFSVKYTVQKKKKNEIKLRNKRLTITKLLCCSVLVGTN